MPVPVAAPVPNPEFNIIRLNHLELYLSDFPTERIERAFTGRAWAADTRQPPPTAPVGARTI